MTTHIELTLACGDYEIMRPLKDGEVKPEGIDLTVLTDMAPSPRHWRFLRKQEYDMAEVTSSGYLASRDHGLPFHAIPVFPHRRFRHGFVFINTNKGITKPTDLIGKKVGVEGVPVHRLPVDARHPRARLRRAAEIDRMVHRTRRGRRVTRRRRA